MKTKLTPHRAKRLTLMLQATLCLRLEPKYTALQLNGNYLVNQMVAGCLDAMEADRTGFDVPFITIYRKLQKRPLVPSARWQEALELFAPKGLTVTPEIRYAFADLINDWDEKLSPEVLTHFWKSAATLVEQRHQMDADCRTTLQI